MDEKGTAQKEFYGLFRKNCLPLLGKYETERKNKFLIFAITGGISGAAFIISLLLYFVISPIELYQQIFIISGACTAIILTIAKTTGKAFERKIKAEVMPEFCKCLGDFQWNPMFGVNSQLFAQAGVIPRKYDKEESDDIFKGTYKDVSIEINEVCYKDIRITYDSKGRLRREEYTLFDGVVAELGMNKNFKSHTVVASDSLLHGSPVSGLRHTTLEDVTFEKMFDVFTNDEVEARYLLTPTFMERLINVKKAFKCDKLSCAFYRDKLFISIDTRKDMFVLGSLTKPADDEKQFFQMFEEITSIIELIDQLKLDKKIGL